MKACIIGQAPCLCASVDRLQARSCVADSQRLSLTRQAAFPS